MKIEKGKRYLYTEKTCYQFINGNTYMSPEKHVLINEQGYEHIIENEHDFKVADHFQLVEEPSTEDLLKRIEDISANVTRLNEGVSILLADKAMNDVFNKQKATTQPCPTAAKFKDIADHANAINDIVKNAPDETIYVPDGILGRGMNILNGSLALYEHFGMYEVGFIKDGWYPSKPKQFKLVKCEREELKAGDVAFRSRLSKPDFLEKSKYCIILEAGSYQFWRGKDCVNLNSVWNHWYKVVEA